MRSQRVFAHTLVDQTALRFNGLIDEQFGQLVAPFEREDGGDRVELIGTTCNRFPIGSAKSLPTRNEPESRYHPIYMAHVQRRGP